MATESKATFLDLFIKVTKASWWFPSPSGARSTVFYGYCPKIRGITARARSISWLRWANNAALPLKMRVSSKSSRPN